MKNGEEDEEGVNDEGHDVGERREGERHDEADAVISGDVNDDFIMQKLKLKWI